MSRASSSRLRGRVPVLAASGLLTGGLVLVGSPAASAHAAFPSSDHARAGTGTLAEHPGQPSPQPAPVMPQAYELAWLYRHMAGASLEQTFMAGMIPHHAMAIAMAREELAKGVHPQLKAMAQQIITSQQQDIAQMRSWLQQWYGMTQEQALAAAPAQARALIDQMGAMMQTQMVAPMQQAPAGEQTDLTFLRLMIPHHEMAIIEARAAAPRFAHPQLSMFAGHIITSQLSEVGQMRRWLHEWYGPSAGVPVRTPAGPGGTIVSHRR